MDDWNLCKTAHRQVACMKWRWGKSSTGGSSLAALPDGEDNDDRCVADDAGDEDYDDDDDDEDEVNLRADNPIWQVHLQE